MKNWEKNWRKWKAKRGNWQVRQVIPGGELKGYDISSAYNLTKKYAWLLVEAGRNGGHTLVAEKMPNRQ